MAVELAHIPLYVMLGTRPSSQPYPIEPGRGCRAAKPTKGGKLIMWMLKHPLFYVWLLLACAFIIAGYLGPRG